MEPAVYLIPVTLGGDMWQQVLPEYNLSIIRDIRCFVVENIRSARRFLRMVDSTFPIDDSVFVEMGKHADETLFSEALRQLKANKPVGVISEAGCPAVADPGADFVSLAQQNGVRVIPLVGPNSMIMAVMASGLNGQGFAFNGYLPVDDSERAKRIKQLESRALTENQTQLFIETPYRNAKMFAALMKNLRPQTRLCMAAGITTDDEYIRTKTIAQWRKVQLPDLSKTPTIFLIGK